MRTTLATPSWFRASATTPPRATSWARSLALPFALVGLAAGWLSDGLLANPLVAAIPRRSQGTAAVLAALVAGALGAVLSHRVSTRGDLGATPLTGRQLAVLVTLAGGVAGAMVGALEATSSWGAVSGAAHGGLSAIAFVPVCALVVAATRRAERARMGSIVAAADQRAVWGLLATALAVMTLAATLDVPEAHHHEAALLPRVGVVMAVAAGLVVFFVLLADALALERVGLLCRVELEDHDPAPGPDGSGVPIVDLGLGDEARARMERAAGAYRSHPRPVSLLLGSVAEARAALRRALLRGAVGLAITGVVLAGHAWAETPAAVVEYEALRCGDQSNACHDAGVLLLPGIPIARDCPAPPFIRRGGPGGSIVTGSPDVPRAEALLRRGCARGNRCACQALDESARRRGAPVVLPSWYVAH